MASSSLSLIALFMLLVIPSECSENVCVKKSACMCVFPNGTGIDLTDSAKGKFYSVQLYEAEPKSHEYKMSNYYFHPCKDLKINHTMPGDTCDSPLSMYREVIEMRMDNLTAQTYKVNRTACEYLGETHLLDISSDGRSIIFHNPPSETTVQLVCAEGEDELHMTSLDDPKDVLLTFYSQHACLKLIEEPGRSFGSTLLIILFSFIIFYIVLGVCTKKFLMGATGIEVIPNLGFWTDLPNLVKDGWVFVISGFKVPTRGVGPTSTPDPNSYDSI